MNARNGVSYIWKCENNWWMSVWKEEKEVVNEGSIGKFFLNIFQ